MARYFITGFVAEGDAVVGVNGFYTDRAAGQYFPISVDNISFDPTLATSARQQIQEKMVDAVNAALPAGVSIIASDIEYIS